MKLKDAMKIAKETGISQQVTEGEKIDEVKVQISLRVDLDALNWAKTESAKKGLGYQTFINSLLHEAMNRNATLEERVFRLEAIEAEMIRNALRRESPGPLRARMNAGLSHRSGKTHKKSAKAKSG